MTGRDWSMPYWNVCFKVDGHFKECGVAWRSKEGETIRLKLDALPLNFDGRLTLLVRDRTPAGPESDS